MRDVARLRNNILKKFLMDKFSHEMGWLSSQLKFTLLWTKENANFYCILQFGFENNVYKII